MLLSDMIQEAGVGQDVDYNKTCKFFYCILLLEARIQVVYWK